MYLTMNIIILYLNVFVFDTFVQRIIILTGRKLRIDGKRKQIGDIMFGILKGIEYLILNNTECVGSI